MEGITDAETDSDSPSTVGGQSCGGFVRLASPARNGFHRMDERTLFTDDQKPERPPAKPVGLPHSGSDTSREAAERMMPAATAQAARVFHFIAERGKEGATDHEVQAELGMTGDSERPRRWSLHRAGLIRDSGLRRKSPAGRQAIVWIASEEK
jgi:hypothetical protein